MSKGGYRPNSGRKKGSIPWNKGKASPWAGKNGFKKGQSAWNKGKSMSDSMKEKMKGNQNGRGNKGRVMSPEWIKKMSDAKRGKPSARKGIKLDLETRKRMSLSRRVYLESKSFSYSYNPKDILRRDRKAIRRERIKVGGGFHSKGEWLDLKTKHNFTCPSCKKKEPEIKLTRDHIVPISMGGSDNIENIQPLCSICNSKKHTNTIKY